MLDVTPFPLFLRPVKLLLSVPAATTARRIATIAVEHFSNIVLRGHQEIIAPTLVAVIVCIVQTEMVDHFPKLLFDVNGTQPVTLTHFDVLKKKFKRPVSITSALLSS